jgi:SAM-dependent methyltransferase
MLEQSKQEKDYMNAANETIRTISDNFPRVLAEQSSTGEMADKFRAVYDDTFFARVTQDTVESARIIVPLLLKLINPASVVDIGCGLGAWLKVCQEHRIKVFRGFDGDYIDRSKLLVQPSCFTAVDLAEPIEIDQRFDLAICLEVAEHLPEAAAPGLVRMLTTVAPFVLFSAAIPGQRGPGHVNEQWPSYWKALFTENGFQRLDPIRRHIWRNSHVQWWYRQNLFLYASRDAIIESEALREEERLAELDVIYVEFLNRYKTLRGVLGELPRVLRETIQRRLFGERRSSSH